MAEILIINVHSSRNAGDAALTLVTLEQLKQHFPHCHFVLAMDDPQSHSGEGQAVESFSSWVKKGDEWRIGSLVWLIPGSIIPILTHRLFGKAVFAFTPKGWRVLLQAYIQAHMIVSKPGGFLYSSGRGVNLVISLYAMALGLLAGKPVYVFPQSIGPFSRRWEHLLAKWVLKRVRVVMAREPISLRQLQSWGLTSRCCYLLPDPAFAFSGAPVSAAEEWLRSHGIRLAQDGPLLGMTVIDWRAQNPHFGLQARYEAACVGALRFFVEQYGGKAFLFPQAWGPSASQDDRIPARRIAGQLGDLAHSVLVIEEPLSPDLLKSVYGLMDLFVGTRMHSNIFALSQGIPVIAIGYQHKTQGIIRMIGLDRWVIDIQQVSEQTLIEMLNELWKEQNVVRARLKQIIPTLVQQAKQAGAIVAADFSLL